MTQAYDSPRLAGAYHQGNEMPEASLAAWVDLIVGYAPVPHPLVVDLGAGTGMFSAALAGRGEATEVVGVEPSAAMREQARRVSAGENIQYVAGSADAIPVPDGFADLVLLSRVIHHVPDRRACARELKRVLKPGGVAVIRTTFRERLDAVVYDYWPQVRESDQERFVSGSALLGEFEAEGFTVRDTVSFAQPVAASLREYRARLASQPQSKFAHLSEAEFAAGLARMAEDAKAQVQVQAQAGDVPVLERYDVMVVARA